MCSHVDPSTMSAFKEILHKYPTAFHLPGTPLGTIKGFYHNIDTGYSPLVYQLPYKKSPNELCAIKYELQRMLSVKIIQPSHSPYRSPCNLFHKLLEEGKPQPPRFVVDYRRVNSITRGDGYLIPSVSKILDALSRGSYLPSWTLPVVTGRFQLTLTMFIKQHSLFI